MNAPEEMVFDILNPALSARVYKGPVADSPDEGVFCLATGGQAPNSFFGQDPQQHKFKSAQIRVRSEKFKFKEGRDLTQSVWGLLKNAQPAGWIIVRMVNSDAIYLGRDAEDRHEWSINIIAEIIE